jgi:hypothetical protein
MLTYIWTFFPSAENNDHFVYFSLVPLLIFAAISFGMIAWSHWCDAPRDYSPYAADVDPTDWLEAVVAASQGGLRFAFAKDALQNPDGLQEARKVRIRLGQVGLVSFSLCLIHNVVLTLPSPLSSSSFSLTR